MGTSADAYRRMIESKPSGFCSWAVFLLLWPPAQVYRLAVRCRANLYAWGLLQSYRASVPVVSVGNLTVGGTGKTPVTDALVKLMLRQGLRVAVVSRGYGGRFRGPVGAVSTGNGRLLMTPEEAGDEPCLLAERNPALRVYVARMRSAGVRAAEDAGAQVVVLDDGFQHLAVRRDFDIVLLDARAPFGNEQLLPAGPLRESPGALRRADLVIMTHAEGERGRPLLFHGTVLRCRHRLADTLTTLEGKEVAWSLLEGREVVAFAGIARPDDFFAALRLRGVKLTSALAMDDHQDYSGDQLNRLLQSCDNTKLLITTEKDAVKLRAAKFPCLCLVAPLSLQFDEPQRLHEVLTRILEKAR